MLYQVPVLPTVTDVEIVKTDWTISNQQAEPY